MIQGHSYERLLEISKRINWRVEDIIGPDRPMDFARPFLPESFARTAELPFLSPAERLKLNQIRGFGYLAMFELVERCILPVIEEHAPSKADQDPHRTAALENFAVEEAKHIEQRLSNLKGSVASEDIILAGELVVQKGEKVGREHSHQVQEVTKELLETIQKNFEEDQKKELETLNREIEELRGEIGYAGEGLRERMEQKLVRLRQQAQTNREQLEGLSQMTFLTENDYRELKSKFGNVFRSGMGAEAFHDILKNMDLEKLSRDLWREVRTSRSKQAAKRATKRLHRLGVGDFQSR